VVYLDITPIRARSPRISSYGNGVFSLSAIQDGGEGRGEVVLISQSFFPEHRPPKANDVPQVSKPAVSPISKSAGHAPSRPWPVRLKTCDEAVFSLSSMF